MDLKVKEEVDKYLRKKDVQSSFYYSTYYLSGDKLSVKRYYDKFYSIKKEYSDSEIIEIENYILNKTLVRHKNYSDIAFFENVAIPRMIFISGVLSKTQSLVYDQNLFSYYKSFYILCGIEVFLEKVKITEENFQNKLLTKNYKFDETTKIGRAVTLYLGLSQTNLKSFDLILNIANIIGDEILNYLKYLDIIKIQLYYNDSKNRETEESFYKMLIDNWTAFGLRMLKDNL